MARNSFPPPPTRDEIWAPLELVAARVVERLDVPLVLPCDFMFMAHIDQPGLPRIFDYKHFYSRRYLHITANGRFARYIEPRDLDDDDDDGRYVLTRASVRKVIEAVETEEWTEPRSDGYCDGCVTLMTRRLQAELGYAV